VRDAWPELRRRILACDILILGTPVWLGQLSSVVKGVLERMDAGLGETDDCGQMQGYGTVAVVSVVGKENGAHAISAHLYQGLNDTGWTIPASAIC
jgi:multimeric flavodoxin WrbA